MFVAWLNRQAVVKSSLPAVFKYMAITTGQCLFLKVLGVLDGEVSLLLYKDFGIFGRKRLAKKLVDRIQVYGE